MVWRCEIARRKCTDYTKNRDDPCLGQSVAHVGLLGWTNTANINAVDTMIILVVDMRLLMLSNIFDY